MTLFIFVETHLNLRAFNITQEPEILIYTYKRINQPQCQNDPEWVHTLKLKWIRLYFSKSFLIIKNTHFCKKKIQFFAKFEMHNNAFQNAKILLHLRHEAKCLSLTTIIKLYIEFFLCTSDYANICANISFTVTSWDRHSLLQFRRTSCD